MQNSKLSTIIVPKLNNSWTLFISKVKEELAKMESSNNERANRIIELKERIPKIKEIIDKSKDNIAIILDYRNVFVNIDITLKSSFDALEFFKSLNNLDNDAAKTLYKKIVESPMVNGLSDEYNSLLLDKDYAKKENKPLEDLVRGKKFDQVLIQKLLDKFELGDEVKKDVLLYSLVSSSVKQSEVKINKEEALARKQEKARLYRDRIKELCEEYKAIKEKYKDLFAICYNIKNNMTPDEFDTYKGYIGNPSEAMKYGFDSEAILMVYTMALFKIREDIDQYIEGIGDMDMNTDKLSGEISFFQELIREFKNIANTINELYQEEIDEEVDEENNKVFFATDPFKRLIVNKEIISSNKNSINAFIRKVNSSNNHVIEGIKAIHMLGVADTEELLGKTIYLLSTTNYKMAYIMVNDCVLVLGIADTSDTKFNNAFNHIIRGGFLAIKDQINMIENGNKDYIELQKGFIKELLSENEMKK